MQNEIWDQIGNFLNSLRCENVERKSYIRFSELREAEKLNKQFLFQPLLLHGDVLLFL